VRLPDGTVLDNPPRPLAPVGQFRAHDYRLIPVERYFELKGKRQLDFISSQGCNFRCAFCSDPFVYGRKWVGLEPTQMATRLQELWDRYHFDDVNFQDETFFTRAQRVQAFADRLVESGLKITWAATMRADQGVRLPDEVWARCKQSGLRRLLVGVESGSDEMLRRIRKDIKIEQVFDTVERMLKYSIAGHFPFIVGFPQESDESIRATLECAKRLRALSPDFLTPIYYFKPYPGSELVRDAVSRGFRLPQTLAAWSEFDYVAGLPGPWVSSEKFRLIERFKFFQELAWKRVTRGNRLLQQLARYRCSRDEYRWPVEMLLMRWLVPAEKLS
jgi:anaerobic magnesium-protoporphyrin IX monomethyl ester cyclase